MHSDEIKRNIEDLMTLSDDPKWIQNEENRDRLMIKAKLLEVMTLNEINWSLFYLKEELKGIRNNLR